MKRLTTNNIVIFLLFIFIKNISFCQDFWQKISDIVGNSIKTNSQNHIFVGTEDYGIYRSTDYGNSWIQANSGLTNLIIHCLTISPEGDILCGTRGGGIFRSTNYGDSWISLNSPNSYQTKIRFNAYGLFSCDGFGCGGIYRSTDNGISWTNLNIPVTCTNDFVVNNSGHLFVGTGTNGIYKTTDMGQNWTKVSGGNICSMVINPQGFIFAATVGNGVLRTTNNGDSWDAVNSNLPTNNFYKVAINSLDHIYICSAPYGFFRSTDNGDTWLQINSGIPGTDISSSVFDFDNNGHLWASIGVSGVGSIWRSTQSTTSAPTTVTDIDGNVYNTVTIGTQTWMAENLKTTKYRNGDAIPNVIDNTAWSGLTTGAYCDYNNTSSNSTTYGKLYNWYAVSDNRNIAPAGWHVPTDAEWTTLTSYLGGEGLAGGKLKESGITHWSSPNTGASNETFFTALPGGARNIYGIFLNIGLGGYWWSSTDSDTVGLYRDIYYNYSWVGKSNHSKKDGFSIRCVKDAAGTPTIMSDKTSLSFNGVQYSSSLPSTQTFTVTNSGGGTLSGSVSIAQSWLTITPMTNLTSGATITVSVNTTNLSPGTYTDTILVTDANATNSPQKVVVTYIVAQLPSISLTTTSLSFSAVQNGSTPSSQSVTISNGGGGTLSWSLSDNASWLDVSPASGTNSQALTVSVNTTNLAPNTYTAAITITATGASNTPQTINISYQVSSNNTPIINLNKNSLSFSATQDGTLPSSQSFSISNIGSGTLNWQVSSNMSWLSLSPGSGSNSQTITANINSTNLTPGTYPAEITVTATGAANTPQKINVSYVVNSKTVPAIGLNTTSLSFTAKPNGTIPTSQTFKITNAANGTLNWTLSSDASWLDVTPSSGSNTGDITVSINTTNMNAGTYNGLITIAASGASNTPQTLSVIYEITALPVITLNKTKLEFIAVQNKSLPTDQSITVNNGGGGILNWTVSDNQTWLDITPTSRTGNDSFKVHINTTNLQIGTYSAIITIAADGAINSPQTVQVNYSMIDGKLLSPVVNTPYISSSTPVAGGKVTTTTPSITWNAVTGATKYGITIYRYSTTGEGEKILEDSTILSTITSYKIPDGKLEKGRWYKIQVRTLSSYDIWGDYTYNPYYFNILSDAPTRILPQTASKVNTITPDFKWNKVQYATGYRLYITDATNNKKYDNSTSGKITDTTFTLPAGILEYAKTYNWTIGTYNEASEVGDLSTTKWEFTTVSSKISLLDKIIYADIDVGKTIDTAVIIKNIGNDTLKITSIIVDGSHLSDFSLPGLNFPIQILQDEQKTIIVRFNPMEGGIHFGRIIIYCNDKLIPEQAIPLRGTGRGSAIIPNTLSKTSGDNQTGKINTQLPTPFTVTITDTSNKPVSGASVLFDLSAPTGSTGQKLSASSALTGSDGKASTTLTFGDKAGTYTVTANATGTKGGPITFSATASLVVIKMIATSGDNQNGYVNQQLANPFIITVTDDAGTPIQNRSIKFKIQSYPSGAIFTRQVDTTLQTDTKGEAKVLFTFGDKAGVYKVTASGDDLTGSPVTFTATASDIVLVPTKIVMVSGNNQSNKVLTNILNPLQVKITDNSGNLVPNVNVKFEITNWPESSTGYQISNIDVKTDSKGEAETVLTLGNKTGQYIVTATSSGLNGSPVTFTFTALPDVAKSITMQSGNNQSGKTGSQPTNPLTVKVTDNHDNPVLNVDVKYEITEYPVGSTGQIINPTNTTTDINGLASSVFTFGTKANTYKVTATSTGLTGSPILFNLTAIQTIPGSINYTSGDKQTGEVTQQLKNPFVVTIKDTTGKPISGVTIVFEITNTPIGSTGYTLTKTTEITNSSGIAGTILTLGNRSGEYKVTATAQDYANSPITFTGTAVTLEATNITLSSGNNQSGKINQPLSNPLTVIITNALGNPVSNKNVTFEISEYPNGSIGQTLSSYSSSTDINGKASTILTLGNKSGKYKVVATAPGLDGSPVIFNASAAAGNATVLMRISGDNQTEKINTKLSKPLIVKVLDGTGNPVQWTSVSFSITSYPTNAGNQSLNPEVVLSDSIGEASTIFTTGNRSGNYTITATVQGITPLTFTCTATAGTAANIASFSGDNQKSLTGNTLTDPLVVVVTDSLGNSVPGVNVLFEIKNRPPGSFDGSLSNANGTTNTNGQTSTQFTLGVQPGNYQIMVTSTNLKGSPIYFTATALAKTSTLQVTSPDIIFPQRQSPSDYKSVDYRIVGIPGNSNKLVKNFLSGTQGIDWQVYWDNGKPGNLEDYLVKYDGSSNFLCNTGKSFWMIGNRTIKISDTITSATLNSLFETEIKLHSGWNLITNPFLAKIQWSKVQTLNKLTEQIYSYNGAFNTSSSFDPYEGYYFYNKNNIDPLKVPYTVTAISKDENINDLFSWKVDISLKAENYTENSTFFGISPYANNGYDGMDQRKPRAFNDIPYTYFERPEWDKELSSFASDVRSDIKEEETWKFKVQSFINKDAQLSFVGLEKIPDNYKIFLVDETYGKNTDLTIYNRYNFTPKTSLTEFKIVVSKSSEIKDKLNDAIKPESFVLGHSYPNPFNPSTTIPIRIPAISTIELSVYNLLGMKINTIYNGVIQPGNHYFTWDGKDNSGKTLSSGVYICRLISDNISLMKKIILSK